MSKETIEFKQNVEILKHTYLEDNYPDLHEWMNKSQYFHWPQVMITRVQFFRNAESLMVSLFTSKNEYKISIGKDYLAGSVQTRKSLPGETWKRGLDLIDGDYSEETFHKIMQDIISHELKPLDPEYNSL